MTGIDAAAARVRVSSLLSTADLEPACVPPASIFIVRSLSDPAPRELSSDASSPRVAARWSRAVQRQLDDLYQHAVRPANGFVGRSAAAVVFRDPAELIACLARDFLNGVLAGCWWWDAWLRATAVASLDDVITAWVREARHAPAAVAMLRRAHLSSAFARSLSSRQARMLLVAIAEAYETPALVAVPHQSDLASLRDAPAAAHHQASREAAPPTAARSRAGDAPEEDVVAPPWAPFVDRSDVPSSLEVEQQTLLGVALALWHAPVAARSRAFARSLHVWREHTGSRRLADVDRSPPRSLEPNRADLRETTAARDVPPPIERPAPSPQVAPEGEPRHRRIPRRASTPAEREIAAATGGPPAGLPNIQFLPAAEHPAGHAQSGAPVPPKHAARPPAPGVAPPVEGDDTVDVATCRSVSMPHGTPAEATSPSPFVEVIYGSTVRAEYVITEIGGVLFLVNALQQLGWFDRLEDDFTVSSTIGGWAWIEIIGRCLLGRDVAADPLWATLALLDGRAADATIDGIFHGTPPYTLPNRWLAPDQSEQLQPRDKSAFDPTPWNEQLGGFLDTLLPYLRWRLLKALAFAERLPADHDALLASHLLCRHSHLEWTTTHVDVRMSIDDADVAVRFAGLDINPGWVPALGRVVTFHFE